MFKIKTRIKIKKKKLNNSLTCAQIIGKKSAETRKKVNSNGLTIDQMNGIRISKTLNKIQENGLTLAQNRAIKAAKTKTTTICENGLTIAQNGGIKASNTLKQIQDDGLTGYQKNGKKISEIFDQVEENGLTRIQNIVDKAVKTKRKIGPDGLDSFERAFKHNTVVCQIKPYLKTNLYYQGKLEKKFLDLVNEIGFIDQISRSRQLLFYKYDEKTHSYHIDFQFNNTCFEIKSHFTYDYFGKDLNLRRANNSKWLAAISKGYKFYVIWDHKYISCYNKNDFNDIEKDLYSENMLLTKKTLLNIFKRS